MPLNLEQAAKALNTSKEMLLRWARQGAIPAMEQDGQYRFERKALEIWANGGECRYDSMQSRVFPPWIPCVSVF